MSNANRKPTNLSIDSALLNEAKALRINLSRAAEDGVKVAVQEARARNWKSENSEAIDSSNKYFEKNGLPLNKRRPF